MVLGAGARALVVPLDVVDLQAGAVAGRAPAVLASCRRTAADRARGSCGRTSGRRAWSSRPATACLCRRSDVHHALADLERLARAAARSCVLRLRGDDVHLADRQLDGVLLEAVDAREGPRSAAACRRRAGASSPCQRPLGEVGVDALAVDDQRREQRRSSGRGTRFSSRAAIASSLCGSIGTSQSGQYCVPSLTNSRRRKWCTSVSVPTVRLAPAAAGALLDRHRGRDAEDRVDVGARGRPARTGARRR